MINKRIIAVVLVAILLIISISVISMELRDLIVARVSKFRGPRAGAISFPNVTFELFIQPDEVTVRRGDKVVINIVITSPNAIKVFVFLSERGGHFDPIKKQAPIPNWLKYAFDMSREAAVEVSVPAGRMATLSLIIEVGPDAPIGEHLLEVCVRWNPPPGSKQWGLGACRALYLTVIG